MADFMIRTDYLRAVSYSVSKETYRYYLQGIYVEPHPVCGVILVATDGHRLTAFYDRDGYAVRPAILSADWRSKDFKALAKEGRRIAAFYLDTGLAHIFAVPKDKDTIATRYNYENGRRSRPAPLRVSARSTGRSPIGARSCRRSRMKRTHPRHTTRST